METIDYLAFDEQKRAQRTEQRERMQSNRAKRLLDADSWAADLAASARKVRWSDCVTLDVERLFKLCDAPHEFVAIGFEGDRQHHLTLSKLRGVRNACRKFPGLTVELYLPVGKDAELRFRWSRDGVRFGGLNLCSVTTSPSERRSDRMLTATLPLEIPAPTGQREAFPGLPSVDLPRVTGNDNAARAEGLTSRQLAARKAWDTRRRMQAAAHA